MVQPVTGTTWNAGGFNDLYRAASERGGLQAVLVRDNRGAATNISPFEDDLTTVAWSPFAQDGKLRADLFASRLVDGKWESVATANEGFWYIGAQTEDGGAERNPNTNSDDLKILQSNFPYDSDITEKGKTIKFTAVDTLKPLIHRLESELRLADDAGNSLVPDLGSENYGYGVRLDTASVDRQILLVFSKSVAGKAIYRVEGYSLCKLDDQGAKKRTKTDPDSAELTYKVLPDPYLMIPDPDGGSELVPGFEWVWVSGPGWDEMAPAGS
ncbi:hypothetical protein [Mycolicibacterium houstonense]|uniref:hypothetical protein n=1 Tax=Mycolicibacterium houstonense TaxID=146021 RepID=UPI0021F37805|nr:hypothetical protein [Mycolicibacterium houstonense]